MDEIMKANESWKSYWMMGMVRYAVRQRGYNSKPAVPSSLINLGKALGYLMNDALFPSRNGKTHGRTVNAIESRRNEDETGAGIRSEIGTGIVNKGQTEIRTDNRIWGADVGIRFKSHSLRQLRHTYKLNFYFRMKGAGLVTLYHAGLMWAWAAKDCCYRYSDQQPGPPGWNPVPQTRWRRAQPLIHHRSWSWSQISSYAHAHSFMRP
ncbi:hypothetical protein EVAR_36537_1 [Eumeta japonica]|uniref:Uncharacterized protein n=1 Tax=Eumeta variegata TaxID=151549 RepID=A0A4C1ZAE3_EUMVA|nr:hypothetical protein EVAR_36537_1 [Eumeta japonica]